MLPSLFTPPLDISTGGKIPSHSQNKLLKSLRALRLYLLRTLFRPNNILPNNLYIFGGKSYIEIVLIIIITIIVAVIGATAGTSGSGSLAEKIGIAVVIFALRNNVLNMFLGISFERAIYWHRVLGVLFALAAGLHGFIQLYGEGGDRRRRLEDEEGGQTLTGIILMSFIFSMGATYLVRHLLFEAFYYMHILIYIGTIPLAFLHGAKGFGLVCIAWAIDLALRFYFSRLGAQAAVEPLPGDIVKVTINKQLKYVPGQFCFLMVPAISRTEFHPFSISSSPHEDRPTFHIKVSGDWTRKLYSLPSSTANANIAPNSISSSTTPSTDLPPSSLNNSLQSATVLSAAAQSQGRAPVQVAMDQTIYIEGPFGSPTVDVFGPTYRVLLFICGGIGMTPCFSMLKYCLYQARHGTRDLKKVVFIWTARDISTFKSIELDLNLEENPNNELESNSIAHYELYLTKKSNEPHPYASVINNGRPNVPDIMARVARYAAEIRETRVGVVTCGPIVLIDEVCDLARSPVYVHDKDLKRPRSQGHTMGQAQDKEPVAFDVHSEVFDF